MITREFIDKATKTTTDASKAIWGSTSLGVKLSMSRLYDLGKSLMRGVHNLRKLWLFLTEVIGVVLVTWGISFWSIPSAIVIGGLVLIAVIEIRPLPGPKFPSIPVPEIALRHQAQAAAEAINNERFGLAMVDPIEFEKLTSDECEKVITLARTVGAKRS
jgi:hypothetical protein